MLSCSEVCRGLEVCDDRYDVGDLNPFARLDGEVRDIEVVTPLLDRRLGGERDTPR